MAKPSSCIPLITRASWLVLFSITLLLSVSLDGSSAVDSCPNCDIANSLLVPCNSSLQINTWPGTLVYQPTQEQAPCGCNQNYYSQIVACLTCESSSSAHYSVENIADYKLVCLSFGQAWKQINLPNATTTTTTTTTATATTTTSSTITNNPSNDTSSKDNNNSLSSGAIAGIAVSIVALIVAISVAVYVCARRRREERNVTDLDTFKYRDTHSDSFMETSLPQYTGMIQSPLAPISKLSNLRVMNPDSDDEGATNVARNGRQRQQDHPSFEVQRNSSPGWRRGSFDDD